MTILRASRTAALVIAALVIAAIGAAEAKDPASTQELVAKIVAVDLAAKSIRIESGTGPSEVLLAVDKAAESLDELPVGQMFKLTVRDGTDGKRREVVSIKRAKNATKP
jgi:hypothetical protein